MGAYVRRRYFELGRWNWEEGIPSYINLHDSIRPENRGRTVFEKKFVDFKQLAVIFCISLWNVKEGLINEWEIYSSDFETVMKAIMNLCVFISIRDSTRPKNRGGTIFEKKFADFE